MNRVMVLKGGSPAIHKLGNLSREDDEYIRVLEENENEYIGHFEEGFGFVGVRFNKLHCRKLTKEEIEKLNSKVFIVNGKVWGKVTLDKEGNYI
ncbi:MAG: hypothetical protein E7211_09730 [Clostridium lundense]|nr:hypothetical protein [Clostridium lundense]